MHTENIQKANTLTEPTLKKNFIKLVAVTLF